MDLETVILSEVCQRQMHDINYMLNVKKKGTNELIYKTEMEYTLMVTKRKEGVNRKTGIDIHILLLLLTHFSCV